MVSTRVKSSPILTPAVPPFWGLGGILLTANDVANWFLAWADFDSPEGSDLTNMKLQKLLYYFSTMHRDITCAKLETCCQRTKFRLGARSSSPYRHRRFRELRGEVIPCDSEFYEGLLVGHI